jgi:hypothetical protein
VCARSACVLPWRWWGSRSFGGGLRGSFRPGAGSRVAELLPLALVAALYPPILAMVVVILARPNPRNLLLAYVLGALFVSALAGLAIVAA